jgi:hypothetical protein
MAGVGCCPSKEGRASSVRGVMEGCTALARGHCAAPCLRLWYNAARISGRLLAMLLCSAALTEAGENVGTRASRSSGEAPYVYVESPMNAGLYQASSPRAPLLLCHCASAGAVSGPSLRRFSVRGAEGRTGCSQCRDPRCEPCLPRRRDPSSARAVCNAGRSLDCSRRLAARL